MLKILNFFRSTTGATKLATQRERFELAQDELNAVLSEMSEMPVITLDAATKTLTIVAPDQFPGEALALPAPSADEGVDTDVKADLDDEDPVTTTYDKAG